MMVASRLRLAGTPSPGRGSLEWTGGPDPDAACLSHDLATECLPGGFAKVPLLSENVVHLGGGRYRIRDHAGRWHLYPPTDSGR